MKILKWLLIVVAALAVVLFGGALFLPKTFTVTRSTDIAAAPDKVYALVESPRQWKRWTVWNRRDPAMQITYSGPETGAGASWSWVSASEGSGTMTFTAADPGRRIAYELTFPEFDSASTGEVTVAPAGAGSRVQWSMAGSMGSSLVFRWFTLLTDRMIGPDFEAGLANLKAEAEKP